MFLRATFQEKQVITGKFEIPDYIAIPLRYANYPPPTSTLEHYELIKMAVSNSEDWQEIEVLCSAYGIPMDVDDLGEDDEIFEVYRSEVAAGRCKGRVVREEYERVMSEQPKVQSKPYTDSEDRSSARSQRRRSDESPKVLVVCSLCGVTIGHKTKSRKALEGEHTVSKFCSSCVAAPRRRVLRSSLSQSDKDAPIPRPQSGNVTPMDTPAHRIHSASSSNPTNVIDLTLNSSDSGDDESAASSPGEEPLHLLSEFKKELFASISTTSKEKLFSRLPTSNTGARPAAVGSKPNGNSRPIHQNDSKPDRKPSAETESRRSSEVSSISQARVKFTPVVPKRPTPISSNTTGPKTQQTKRSSTYSQPNPPNRGSGTNKHTKITHSAAEEVIFEDDEIVRVEGPNRMKRKLLPLSEETRKARKIESERRLEQRSFKEFSSRLSDGFLINNKRPDEQEPELFVHSHMAVLAL